MSARTMAAFCLLNLVLCAAWGASNDLPASPVVVYLSADPGQSSHVLDSMRRELDQLMQTAGYEPVWQTADARPENTPFPILVVRLEGVCSMPAGSIAAAPREKPESLGSTAVSDGQVLPFATVHCTSLVRMLTPDIGSEPASRRDFLFGRAVARVLAHEFYHVLLGEREHSADGVAKPIFSPGDLTGEHFEFEAAILARLQRKAPGPVSSGEGSAAFGAAGRND